jgi:hypothetical protein
VQKVDTINTFIIAKSNYYLRAALPSISWVQQLDNEIRATLKRSIGLPKRTVTQWFYVSRKSGGLGLFSLVDNLHIARVSQVFRCLSSPDDFVVKCSFQQLRQVVARRTGKSNPTTEDLQIFLNSPPGAQEGKSGDVKSLWTEARSSIQLSTLKFDLPETTLISQEGHKFNFLHKHLVNKYLRARIDSLHLEGLVRAQDQGRVFPLVSLSPASNSWIGSGKYMSFAQYRFGIKARCNLLPVRTVAARMQRNRPSPQSQDVSCRVCSQEPETLGHVLNACSPNVGLYRQRHNQIVERIRKAVASRPNTTTLIDQKIPGSSVPLRPDVTLIEDNKITIVDVTIPFESGPDAFEKARAEKDTKYSDLLSWARTKYSDATYSSLIVGSLGSWDPANEDTLKHLKIGKNYAKLFRQLCCIDCIGGSLDVWKAHTSNNVAISN